MGSAVIFSGTDVLTLKSHIDMNRTVKILQGTADPTSSAPETAPKGSIYLRTGASGGTAYLKQDAGSTTNWTLITTGSAATQYDAIVASPAIAGFSTHTTIAAAIAAVSAGDEILIMNMTFTENVSVNKTLHIVGQGDTSVISGTLTFTSAADYTLIQGVKITGTITINSGADGITLRDCFVPSTWNNTTDWVDNGSGTFAEMTKET